MATEVSLGHGMPKTPYFVCGLFVTIRNAPAINDVI